MNDVQRAGAGVGLVLSGGGAKGAYQAGVVRALHELGIRIDAVSGASIGALNGALIVSAPSLHDAARNLHELWNELASVSPIRVGRKMFKVPAYLLALSAFGLQFRAASTAAASAAAAARFSQRIPRIAQWLAENLFKALSDGDEGLLCQRRMHELIDRFLPGGGLPKRIPLYVSVYPSEGELMDLLRITGATLDIAQTRDSEFMHVQSLPENKQKVALLASAALPLLFAPQTFDGQPYTDGGQGGWGRSQGNTPIQPLLEAGCRTILVTHLSDGSFWDHRAFPEAYVIDLRPSTLSRGTLDLLGFDNERISDWMERGYEDTMRHVGELRRRLQLHSELHVSEQRMRQASDLDNRAGLRRAMKRLT
jgi:NTE family protein